MGQYKMRESEAVISIGLLLIALIIAIGGGK